MDDAALLLGTGWTEGSLLLADYHRHHQEAGNGFHLLLWCSGYPLRRNATASRPPRHRRTPTTGRRRTEDGPPSVIAGCPRVPLPREEDVGRSRPCNAFRPAEVVLLAVPPLPGCENRLPNAGGRPPLVGSPSGGDRGPGARPLLNAAPTGVARPAAAGQTPAVATPLRRRLAQSRDTTVRCRREEEEGTILVVTPLLPVVVTGRRRPPARRLHADTSDDLLPSDTHHPDASRLLLEDVLPYPGQTDVPLEIGSDELCDLWFYNTYEIYPVYKECTVNTHV